MKGCAWQGACMAKGGGAHGKGGDMLVGETATEAGGTHPTGRHSCLIFFHVDFDRSSVNNDATGF